MTNRKDIMLTYFGHPHIPCTCVFCSLSESFKESKTEHSHCVIKVV